MERQPLSEYEGPEVLPTPRNPRHFDTIGGGKKIVFQTFLLTKTVDYVAPGAENSGS